MRQSVLWPLALALPLFAACRGHFDRVLSDAAIDGPPPVLSCAAPSQFSISGTVAGLAAAATATGYYAFVIDGAGEVHGFSYGFDGDVLAPRKADVSVYSGATVTTTVTGIGKAAAAAIPVGDDVLLATVYGQPDPAGIALIPRDRDLASLGGSQMHAGWFGLDSTLARTPDGTLTLLGAQSSLDVDAKLVTPGGSDAGVPHTVIDRSETIGSAVITASDSGFLVTWSAAKPSPAVRAEILDKQLAVAVPPTRIDPGTTAGGNDPRAAYAPIPDRYLFAWWLKVGTSDEVYISLRDSRLAEIQAATLSPHGKSPRIIAGDDGFLVVWQDPGFTSGLAAARVKPDGNYSIITVAGHGGGVLAWDLVTRAGQPALMWIENGPAPTLWLNPLCN